MGYFSGRDEVSEFLLEEDYLVEVLAEGCSQHSYFTPPFQKLFDQTSMPPLSKIESKSVSPIRKCPPTLILDSKLNIVSVKTLVGSFELVFESYGDEDRGQPVLLGSR